MGAVTERPKRIGAYLKDLREAKAVTLRRVEIETGISSGHLSLIENGLVKNPSPTVLQRLASFYGISAEHLLVLAGYLRPSDKTAKASALHGIALAAMDDLTDEDVEQITDLVAVLRKRRARKA